MTNFTTGTGTGGPTFTSDTEGGAEVPVTKMSWGAAGSGQRVSASAPLPVVQTPVGRAISNLFMAAPVAMTITEALQSLTGFKGTAAVAATTTPAVVSTGKTFRAQSITITYLGTAATVGSARVNIRANAAGVVAVTSPLVASFTVGLSGTQAAGTANTVTIPLPEGMDFAAGTGIGVTAQGFVGTTATAVGQVQVTLNGYEF